MQQSESIGGGERGEVGAYDVTWYLLAEAEIRGGLDVGLTDSLMGRLTDGVFR